MMEKSYIAVLIVVVFIIILLLWLTSSSHKSGTIRKRRRDEIGAWHNVDDQCSDVDDQHDSKSTAIHVPPTSSSVNISEEDDYNTETLKTCDAFAVWGKPTKYASVKFTYSTEESKTDITVYDSLRDGVVSGPICWIMTANKALIAKYKARLLEDSDFDPKTIVKIVPLYKEVNTFTFVIDDEQNTSWFSGLFSDPAVTTWEKFDYKRVNLQKDDIPTF